VGDTLFMPDYGTARCDFPGGKEVAERMEGSYHPDFYGPYLEDRMAQGLKAL
jgi:glyoxylase-like metal-dependent hydrolase (beta-lactamase superfamily II)